jgi:hypothetical protein
MARVSFCVFLLIACCCGSVFGQAARSPFSSFGIGEYNPTATTNQQGMAGVGVSNPEMLFINTLNPALLVFNGYQGITTFQAGILGEQRTVRDAANKDVSKGGNLNYLILCFPIKSGRWVTSIASMPYSIVRYNFAYMDVVPNAPDSAAYKETGNGGINQVAWSHGIKLHKWVSVGARASYLYSTIENSYTNYVKLTNQLYVFSPDVHQRYNYKGFTFQGSFSLHIDSLFNKNYRLNIGAVYDLQSTIHTDYLQTLIRTNGAAQTIGGDTLTTVNSGRTVIPSALSAGISFGRSNVWVLAVDVRMTDYTKFGFFETQQTNTTRGMRVAAGFQLTPSPNSLSSYLKIITYRTGVSLEESPYLVNGNTLRDFGTNFGLSLPVSRGCSVDLSGRWGKRGSIETNTVEEKYFKVYFGVTFNDRWFIKRRFD